MSGSLDAIVIGAGQAGPSLAVRLANAGKKTALIEKRMLGGTCVNDGCIPTKALVASARAAWVVAHAARWGVSVPGHATIDMQAVKARKDRVVQDSRDSLANGSRARRTSRSSKATRALPARTRSRSAAARSKRNNFS